MSFVFYPKLEQSCPNVSHCPHLGGGAAIGILVNRANDNELYLRQLHGTIDVESKRNSDLFEENQRLQKEWSMGTQCASTSRRIVANESFVQGKI